MNHMQKSVFWEKFSSKGIQDLGYGLISRISDCLISKSEIGFHGAVSQVFADETWYRNCPELYTVLMIPIFQRLSRWEKIHRDACSWRKLLFRAFDRKHRHPIHGRRIAKWVSISKLSSSKGRNNWIIIKNTDLTLSESVVISLLNKERTIPCRNRDQD